MIIAKTVSKYVHTVTIITALYKFTERFTVKSLSQSMASPQVSGSCNANTVH